MPSTKSRAKLKFEAIGAPWEIELFDGVITADLEKEIRACVEQFDATYSRFRSDSWVSKLAEQAGRYELPADAWPLLSIYQELYKLTGGKVTPLIGKNLVEAGYDAQYSFRPKQLTKVPAWDEALVLDETHLTTKVPILLDFGAAGKGYLVDQLASVLEKQGITSFVVDGSGDLVVRDVAPAQRIGLENPSDVSEVIGYIEVSTGALCASAGNRRRWGQYHHIIDPVEYTSPRQIEATWVLAGQALVADGLATALFFCSAETLQKRYTFEYAMVDAHNQLSMSENFPATFFNE